jgi:hypothetical protein
MNDEELRRIIEVEVQRALNEETTYIGSVADATESVREDVVKAVTQHLQYGILSYHRYLEERWHIWIHPEAIRRVLDSVTVHWGTDALVVDYAPLLWRPPS